MVIADVIDLKLPGLKVIRFLRFSDHRGYFTEHLRLDDLTAHASTGFLRGFSLVQANESRSRPRTVRGLHLQWNPCVGKLVRTLRGRMVDLALDVRLGSPTLGKVIAYDMPAMPGEAHDQWIWVPPGFAHGNYFTEDTTIEYLCTGAHNPDCDKAISPLAPDLDWSLCGSDLRQEFEHLVGEGPLMSDRDRHGLSLSDWLQGPDSRQFNFG